MKRVTTRAGRAARAEKNAIAKIDRLTSNANTGTRMFEWDGEIVTALEWLRRYKAVGGRPLRSIVATRDVPFDDLRPNDAMGEAPNERFAGTGTETITETGMTFRPFDFGTALSLLKTGRRLQRSGWNGPGQYIELQRPDENSKMNLPYVYILTASGQLVPWIASQTDLLAEDWRTVE